jgi:hypothetical protein
MSSAGGLAAQEVGGLNVTFDVSQNLESRREEGFIGSDGSSFRSVTGLAFGLSSETRSQSIDLGLSSALAATFGDEDDLALENNQATLDYTRSSRDSALSFGARYRRDEVDDLVFDSTLADEDITTGEGAREVLTLNTGLVLGREARVTGTFNHVYETSVFYDTFDPTLNDSDTQGLDARISFQLTRAFSADVFATWREINEQGLGATDRETRRTGISASYAISPITTVSGEIAYGEEESRSATVLETDGLNYGLSLVRSRPNGAVNLNYSQEEALTGTRRQLIAGQDLELERGDLGYSFGVTETEGFDAQFLANLTFDFELDRNSSTRIELSQDGTINGDDQEVVNSRLNLSYTRELTRVSQVSANFALVDEDVLVAGAADQRSIEFGVTYSHALAEDWGVTSGYEYSSVRLDGAPDRDRRTVFVGLQKSFAYRP